MEAKKKKSNLLEGEDPESAINAKYCEAIREELKKRKNLPDEVAKRKTSKAR